MHVKGAASAEEGEALRRMKRVEEGLVRVKMRFNGGEWMGKEKGVA